MSDQTKGLLITLFGVLFVVPDSLFVRLIPADPLTIAFWRVLLAGGGTAIWLVLRGGAAHRSMQLLNETGIDEVLSSHLAALFRDSTALTA